MKKVRFELSEVALNQVETVYETIKSLVKLKDYKDLETYLNTTVLSAKQYYCLLDELIMTDRLFNDIKFAKILFSSNIQHLNDEYCNIVGEPLAQTLLYDVHNLSDEMVYELFTEINLNHYLANYNSNSFVILAVTLIVLLFILTGIIDAKLCLKVYSKIVWICLLIYAFQWCLYILNIQMSFKLLPQYASSWSYLDQICFGMSPFPTSLFSERAHLSQFIAPYVAICLFNTKSRL
jgi:hypothetical protein